MTTTQRMKAVEGSLTPRQIALVEIEEHRGFGSPSACLLAIIEGRAGRRGSLADRVFDSIKRAHKGEKPELVYRLQREGLREAWFLFSLSARCTMELEQVREAIGMQRKYVHSLAMMLYLTSKGKAEWLDQLPDPCEEADTYLWRVRGLRDAVRLIEREYFDGRPILFTETEKWLASELATAESLADLYNTVGDVAIGSEPPETTAERARTHAQDWVTFTRAEVHERLGEREGSNALLRPLLQAGKEVGAR